jgi:arylsulfatase A-like enzyme
MKPFPFPIRSLVFLFSTLAGLSAGESTAPRAGAVRPNIVFIMSDDMGWAHPGFNGGDPRITPNLDRLAKEGLRLTQFYAQSVCSPTRTALLTGRYPFRTWMDWRSEDFGKSEFLDRLGLTLPKAPDGRDTRRIHGLDLKERTLATALREAGYYTAITGKWHLGEWVKGHLPLQRGFDHQYGHYAWGIDYSSKMILHHTPAHFTVYDWHRNEQPLQEQGYVTDLIAAEAERVIAAQNHDRPFFLYVAFNAPHGPLDHAPRYVKEFGILGATLKIMDDSVGRVLTALEKKGLSQNTLVIFTNDNGGLTEESNRPLRGKKDTNWEGGVRVPALLRWPGVIEAGRTSTSLIHMTDFYPTLIKLAGGSLEQDLPLDGLDMTRMLLQRQPSPRDEIIFEVAGSVRVPAIRQGDHKLVGHELFNLALDPGETTDIATFHPQIVARLKARLKEVSSERPPLGEMTALMVPPLPYIYGELENRNPPKWLIEVVEARRRQQPQTLPPGVTPWPKPPPPVPPLW